VECSDVLTAAAAVAVKRSAVGDASPLHLTLLSADHQQHVVNVADSLALDCRFHAVNYNLFDFPVLWRKRQLDDDVQVNVMRP